MAFLWTRATTWFAMMFLRANPAPSFICGGSRMDLTLAPTKFTVCGYLPQTAAFTMLALYIGTLYLSMMASVTAAQTTVNPVVYSTPAASLSSGTIMVSSFPSFFTSTRVSSSSVT